MFSFAKSVYLPSECQQTVWCWASSSSGRCPDPRAEPCPMMCWWRSDQSCGQRWMKLLPRDLASNWPTALCLKEKIPSENSLKINLCEKTEYIHEIIKRPKCVDVSILPLSKHLMVLSARATRNSVVLRRLKARAVQACPVFCTKRNLHRERSNDKHETREMWSMLSLSVCSLQCLVPLYSRVKFMIDTQSGTCRLKKKRKMGTRQECVVFFRLLLLP